MIITQDNQRLYLKSWEYNVAQIISELAKIVENHGGRVKYGHPAIISNRSIGEAIYEEQERINRLRELLDTTADDKKEIRLNVIKNCEDKIAEYNSIRNEPITVTHSTYITFILDDILYYYQVDDNPFFEFYYHKIPVVNGEYIKDYYLDKDEKEWLYDCFLKMNCAKGDIVEGANLIFNMLTNAKTSEQYREKKKVRVPNQYNDGYHYETVYEKQRKEKIDF